MRAVTLLSAAALVAAAAVSGSPGRAQTFACSPETAGQLSVQAYVQCECRWFVASGLSGTPAGYRWDCGILRARTNHEVPETANPYPYPLPPALSIEGPLIREDFEDRDRPRHRLFPQAG
jgi:hypothetical protein